MPLRETLTVEIVADSASLEAELARAAALVDGLSARVAGVGTAADQAAAKLSGIGGAVAPVTKLGGAIARLVGQLRGVGQTPVTINTAPASASLSALSEQIAAVAAQLKALNAASAAGPAAGLGAAVGRAAVAAALPAAPPVRGFATGGEVRGPAGVDRVPAMLTAGEFVLRAPAARDLGRPLLDALNAGLPLDALRPRETIGPEPSAPSREPRTQPGRTPDPPSDRSHPARPTPFDAASPDRPPRPNAYAPSPPDRQDPTAERPLETSAAQQPAAPAAPPPAPVVNEITVQVTHAVDLDELLRDLQLGQTAALDRLR